MVKTTLKVTTPESHRRYPSGTEGGWSMVLPSTDPYGVILSVVSSGVNLRTVEGECVFLIDVTTSGRWRVSTCF